VNVVMFGDDTTLPVQWRLLSRIHMKNLK